MRSYKLCSIFLVTLVGSFSYGMKYNWLLARYTRDIAKNFSTGGIEIITW